MKRGSYHRGAGRLSCRGKLVLAACGAITLLAVPAQADVTRIKNNPSALILDGARVSDDMETFYLSGQLASPLDTKKAAADVKSVDEMGDSKAQTISVLGKIKTLLESQGYKMSDLVKLTLFVAPDPKTGKMDFNGVNDGFKQFFGTAENPNTVARSTFQVAALVGPYYLIEIEGIAVRKRASPLSAVIKEQIDRLAAESQASDEAGSENAPVSAPSATKFKPEMRARRPVRI